MNKDVCKENSLKHVGEYFDYYLDNSADCDTIKYEVMPIYEFGEMLELAKFVDEHDEEILKASKSISQNAQVHTNRAMLFDFIRELWDIAYSYGFNDGQVDAGLTLNELED